MSNDTITIKANAYFNLTFEEFKDEYCEDYEDELALKIWNKMLKDTDGKVEEDDDELDAIECHEESIIQMKEDALNKLENEKYIIRRKREQHDISNVPDDTITFTQNLYYTLTFQDFKHNYCEDDEDELALKIWNKMLKNTKGEYIEDDADMDDNSCYEVTINRLIKEALEDLKDEDKEN